MFLDNLIFAPLYLFSKAKVILILLSAYNVTFEPLATRDGARIKRSRIEVVFHGQQPKNTPYAFKIQKNATQYDKSRSKLFRKSIYLNNLKCAI